MAQWIGKRKEKSDLERQNAQPFTGVTPEEDLEVSKLDNVWDLDPKNNRFVRVGLRKFETSVYAYIKVFKLTTTVDSKINTISDKWTRQSSLSLTMDELINVTKIIGSESSETLTETDLALRESFELAMTSSLEAIRCNSAPVEGKKMKTKVVEVEHKLNGETIGDEGEVYTQSQFGDDFPEDFAIPVTEDLSYRNEQDADIWRSPIKFKASQKVKKSSSSNMKKF